MRDLFRKILLFTLALTHFAAAVGYAGIEHHCLRQHHPRAEEAACCCENQPKAVSSPCPVEPSSSSDEYASCCAMEMAPTSADAETSCCPFGTAPFSSDRIESGPMLVNSTCCEVLSRYHRVEESGPPASSFISQAVAGPISLFPYVKEFSKSSLCRILTSSTVTQLTLPLII